MPRVGSNSLAYRSPLLTEQTVNGKMRVRLLPRAPCWTAPAVRGSFMNFRERQISATGRIDTVVQHQELATDERR